MPFVIKKERLHSYSSSLRFLLGQRCYRTFTDRHPKQIFKIIVQSAVQADNWTLKWRANANRWVITAVKRGVIENFYRIHWSRIEINLQNLNLWPPFKATQQAIKKERNVSCAIERMNEWMNNLFVRVIRPSIKLINYVADKKGFPIVLHRYPCELVLRFAAQLTKWLTVDFLRSLWV